MADILHQTMLGASPAKLFEALTEQAHIQQWWSHRTEAEPKVGALNKVSFYGGMAVFSLRVKELTPNQSVVWAVEGGPPDWANTTITWTIGEHDGKTMLHLAHRGFASQEGNFANVNYTWGWYVTSLKFYLEKGAGMPHTDADMM